MSMQLLKQVDYVEEALKAPTYVTDRQHTKTATATPLLATVNCQSTNLYHTTRDFVP